MRPRTMTSIATEKPRPSPPWSPRAGLAAPPSNVRHSLAVEANGPRRRVLPPDGAARLGPDLDHFRRAHDEADLVVEILCFLGCYMKYFRGARFTA